MYIVVLARHKYLLDYYSRRPFRYSSMVYLNGSNKKSSACLSSFSLVSIRLNQWLGISFIECMVDPVLWILYIPVFCFVFFSFFEKIL